MIVAQDIAKILQIEQQHTYCLISPRQDEIENVFRTLLAKIEARSDLGDFTFIFIYFAGHGTTDQN